MSSPFTPSPPASRVAVGQQDVAFLIHSQESLANLPPCVDNTVLARQKRRRTSKEDEDILKAEYKKNPKPDKATRLVIVRMVSLGEKEVQIWFQNKRQNDRRRSRPLEPSSSASLMSSSSTMSDPLTEDDFDHAPEREVEECPKSDPPEIPSDEKSNSLKVPESADSASVEVQTKAEPVDDLFSASRSIDIARTEIVDSQPPASASQKDSRTRTSWISNRRSASFVRGCEDYTPGIITFPNFTSTPVEVKEMSTTSKPRSLKRIHSFVRISTNEEGTARIVTDLDKTPSPPHAKTSAVTFARAAAGLRRSYSAAGLNDRLSAASRGEPRSKMQRATSSIGRSMDSRAWEFWCDPDSRSATSLTTRAEQEGSGSAADAIGILRANRKILAQNHARQNRPLKVQRDPSKVLGSPGVKKSRGAVQRAATVNGRFSTKEYKSHHKSGDTTESEEFPQTESDKENWCPEGLAKVQKDRDVVATPRASRKARQILGENIDVMSQSSSLGAMLAKHARKGSKEVVDPEQDDELRQFMKSGGESGRSSLSSAEEAGCVEGLLALSQGQWK